MFVRDVSRSTVEWNPKMDMTLYLDFASWFFLRRILKWAKTINIIEVFQKLSNFHLIPSPTCGCFCPRWRKKVIRRLNRVKRVSVVQQMRQDKLICHPRICQFEALELIDLTTRVGECVVCGHRHQMEFIFLFGIHFLFIVFRGQINRPH